MSARHRRHRGQAVIELALSLPVIVLLSLGGTDLGRAFYYQLPVSTAASAGARTGVVSNTNDIGLAIRTQSGAMPNNAATWGTTYTSDCSNTTIASQTCGDSGGCASTSSFWTSPPAGQPNPVACFAVRSCTIETDTSATHSHDGQCSTVSGACTASSAWQIRPLSQANAVNPPCLAALQIKVVYRFTPVTPLIANFFSGTGNQLFITQTDTVVEQY